MNHYRAERTLYARLMDSTTVIRAAVEPDFPRMARLHVASWRETYRGLMPDDVLDAPDFVERRERFWTAVLSDPRYEDWRAVVAERDGELVGIGMAGPAMEPEVDWTRQLFVLYAASSVHGSGVGSAVLEAVLDPDAVTGLWVADPNPRAQAFYRKHGFDFDGVSKIEDGVTELRLVRR